MRHPTTTPALTVSDEWDLPRAGQLRDDLVAACAAVTEQSVVVDVSGVTFIDSTCLGVLVATHKRLASEGRGLVLQAPPSHMLTVLRITRLDRFLDVRP